MLFIKQLSSVQVSIGVAKTFAIAALSVFATTATINQPLQASDINFLEIYLTDASKVVTLTAEDLFNQGVDKQNKGDLQGAVTAYTEAIRLNPDYADAYINRGVARNELGDKKGAIKDYNQALRINPKDANAYYYRGLARDELGDKPGAIADFQKFAELSYQQ